MKSKRLLIQAAGIADGDRVHIAPGAMIIDRSNGQVLAVGSPEGIGHIADAERCELTSSVLVPGLVNAHAHLDLTHIGPFELSAMGDGLCDDDTGVTHSPQPTACSEFVSWVDVIRVRRAAHPADIRASVLDGAAKSVTGGTAFIGDIAGVSSLSAVEALRDSELRGVSYLEIFGQGAKEESAIALLDSLQEVLVEVVGDGVRAGIQPHAPYSCSFRVYQHAARQHLPLATHLAETQEELAFVRDADGPLAELLKRLGVWDDSIKPTGLHPVDHLADVLAEHPFTAAHLNYLEDRHLDQLADWPISVVYCPRASAYFGHRVQHRYRDMLDRGINVALGTDSILCLDTPDRISVLDEMRLLLERDSVDPQTLLRMATVNGARALGIDPKFVTFSPGSTPGVIALPIDAAIASDPLREAIGNPTSAASLQFIIKPHYDNSLNSCAC